jgi:hypothetical protein
VPGRSLLDAARTETKTSLEISLVETCGGGSLGANAVRSIMCVGMSPEINLEQAAK